MSNHAKNQARGATMVEYALIIGLISMVAVAIMKIVGMDIANVFTALNTAMTS